ncbi:tRNA dihydrouridine(20/20a) synthase DusA [Candidatus Ichthyocystis hellenicum]|uniref:tRNA dihydrouridine(20/20a) synthase DusA n=1 Tax=Candidatus Ichthyocystis hellenicum TaxID=1561003 RepID=UPI000B24BD01|nr:tRNA dihydrouridine(20/20a) synthase DusA [Candidatus Ichthyocystis hellenicum]
MLTRDIFSVAPMVDYTDRHARVFHRLLSKYACLYTEMLTTNSIIHSRRDLLYHPDDSGRVVLQLGGNVPSDLSLCSQKGERAGYSAINLNCGCPSSRVIDGGFGVGMMKDTKIVVSCLKAMMDAVSIDVTIKHRLGIDYTFCYSMFRDFVGAVAESGVRTFIIHARNAILERKVSPKMNLSALTLRYDLVYRIKDDFPNLCIVINGHILNFDDVVVHLKKVDGVMLGRKVLNDPWFLRRVDSLYGDYAGEEEEVTRQSVVRKFVDYALMQEKQQGGVSAYRLMKYIVNIMNGTRGACRWRRIISSVRRNSDMAHVLDFIDDKAKEVCLV